MAPTLGNGKICYLEIPADDAKISAEFFRRVFGWIIRIRGDGATSFDDNVGQVSGAFVLGRPAHRQIGLLVYIMVDDAAATLQAVAAAGGGVVTAIGADLPEITARISDPFGNVFGIYQNRS
jgi:predicted enzyme related to lactoylglutathione lyase